MTLVLYSSIIGYGQQKELKNITLEDYNKWYTLRVPKVSNDGTWLTYKLDYIEEKDTLIIQQTQGDKRYIIPGGKSLSFIGEKWLKYKDDQNILGLLDLNRGKFEKFPDVTQIILSDNKNFLMFYKKEKKQLLIKHLKNKDSVKIEGVINFTYHVKSEIVCTVLNYNSKSEIRLLTLGNSIKEMSVTKLQTRKIQKISWTEDGNCLLYQLGALKITGDTLDSGILGYYNLKEKKKLELNLSTISDFPKEYAITRNGNQMPFQISKDGKRIFFLYKRKTPLKPNNIPEIWRTRDPYIYKFMKRYMNFQNNLMAGFWDIEKNQFSKLTDFEFPEAILDPDQEYALLYNPATYEPQPRLYPPIDLYLKNLKTGQKELLLKEHHNALRSIFFSPSGDKVVYFKEGIWWYYDLKRNKHFNLNQKLNTIRKRPLVYDSANKSVPPGWVEGEESIYMYDEFDLWEVPIGKGKPKRVTRGRDKGIHYKLITTPDIAANNKYSLGTYSKNQQLLFFLDTEDKMKYGFAIKKSDTQPKIISLTDSYMSKHWQNSSKDGSVFTYLEENNNVPPRIMAYDTKNGILDTVFQGNPHYRQYKHGRSKKVYYTNKYGDKLSGILRYPVNYNKDSLYPMVVYVYETQRAYFHQYTNPGMYNGAGYNPTNLVNEGYFVFLPDIEYKIGEPGFSAADCIISGTKAAIQSAAVNPNKVALMGHSFGGYETLFTITQTNLFKTAISGSGNGDIIRSYLYIDYGSSLNYDDYEFSQYRMGNSLFEDYQGYLDNSALYHAKNIQTPLLLWSGKEDFHVNYYQSISFHLALKRMGKKNTLLLYPKEGHVFNQKINQKDITLRIQHWLAYYLKDESWEGWFP